MAGAVAPQHFVPGVAWTGSTQDEVSSLLEASIAESKISGGDRPIAWDGATKGGQDLAFQVCPCPVWPFLLCPGKNALAIRCLP
jgi:hypothetical protein